MTTLAPIHEPHFLRGAAELPNIHHNRLKIVRIAALLSFTPNQAPNHAEHRLPHRKSSRLMSPILRTTLSKKRRVGYLARAIHRFNPGKL